MADDNEKWWPSTPAEADAPFGAGALAYAALGPTTTRHLIDLCDAAVARGLPLEDGLERLLEDLRSSEGRAPDLLVLMAMAVQASAQLEGFDVEPKFGRDLSTTLLVEVYKHLGGFVQEAMTRFGFDMTSFIEYVTTQWRLYDGAWPPAGAAYTRNPPASVQAPVSAEVDMGNASDPLWEWRSLAYRHFERTTLIGAHMVDMSAVTKYREELERAFETIELDLDVKYREYEGDPERDRNRETDRHPMRAAIDKVAGAEQLLNEAIEIICPRVFST